MSLSTTAAEGSRSRVDDPDSRVVYTNLLSVISTALISLLILARLVSFIEIGQIANFERLLVPMLIIWASVVVLLQGRVNLPWAFLLLLAPGLVMLLYHRELEPSQLIFPLVAMAIFVLPIRWRPIALSVGILIMTTAIVLVVGAWLGVDYRGGSRNANQPWLFRELPGMINVPGRTLALSLPLVFIGHQKGAIGRRVTIGLTLAAVLGILLTGSRANMSAAAGFLLVVYVLKGGRRNWFLVGMVTSIGVLAIAAFLMSGRESPFRWGAVSRMANETAMLVKGMNPPSHPLARSIITASSVSVIRDNWLVGSGNSYDQVARTWADERGLFIKRQVHKDGKWHLHIHGSFFIMAAKSGLLATLVFLGGLALLAIRSVRLRGISGSKVVLATFALIMFSQIGGHTLSKVFCLTVIGLVLAAAEFPRMVDRRAIPLRS